jgi:hypothetical protein
MLIAFVCCPYNKLKYHNQNIKELKEKHGFKNEIKWSSLSKSKYAFYSDLIDHFFGSDLQFRAIVIDKSMIRNNEYFQSFDDFYFKMYYQLIYHKISMEDNYNVYLDIKDTLSAFKVKKLKEILNIQYSSIRTLQNIRSNESLLMQMTDVLMGAIAYKLNGGNKVIAKNRLIEKMQSYTNLSLTSSTPKSHNKFNLFFIDLKD